MDLLRAVVEDNLSPLEDGRVRVRILGIHTDDKTLVKTEELPWAEVMGSLSNTGSGLGLTNVPQIGAWVFVTLEFGNSNRPIIVGSIPGQSVNKADTSKGFNDPKGLIPIESRLNEYDTNRLTRGDKLAETIHQEIIDSDLACAGNNIPTSTDDLSVYPDNVVYEDKAGNVIEIDSTAGNERFRIFHGKSKTRIEIDKDGNVITQTPKNIWNKLVGLFSLDATGNVVIKGDVKVIGNLQVSTTITAKDVTASVDIKDATGTLKELRTNHETLVSKYNSHTHTGNLGAPTPLLVGSQTDAGPSGAPADFTWSGTPN